MSKHTSKQNSLSARLGKKPYGCVYEKKRAITSPNEQVLVDKYKIDALNQLADEVLETIPDSEPWLMVSKVLAYIGQRKESQGTAIPKDSSN